MHNDHSEAQDGLVQRFGKTPGRSNKCDLCGLTCRPAGPFAAFTLAECLLASVVLVLAVTGALLPLAAGQAQTAYALHTRQATGWPKK